jgi:hypothetical protein
MRKINALILGLVFLGVSAFAQNGANELKASSGARDLNYVKSNHIIKTDNAPAQKKVTGYLYESFEGAFPPAGWSLLNLDGGTGWAQNTVGSLWPGWNTMTQTVPPGGGNKAVYATYGDVSGFDYQVLITPAFTVAIGDSLKYWLSRFGGYQDSVFVKISNTGSAIQDFDVTLLEVDSIDLVETIWTQYKHDLSAYVGQTIFVAFIERIADNLNNGAVISLDLVKLGTPYTTDAGVSAITNPTSGVGLGTESVTVTVNDYGTDNMVNVPLSYKIVGGSVVNQAYSGTINGGASNTFTFTTGANLSAGGNFTIKAWTSLPGDMDPSNDTTTITITNTLCALGNLLYDNGPIFNQTGTGPGGANFSFLQDSIESYGIKTGNGSYRCSDDLIVGSQGYIIDGFAFFTYQTGGPVSPSSVTSLDLRVWNGKPSNAASVVVWGDTSTNVLSCSFFSNVYRGDDVLMANRAIMKNVVLLSTPINLAVGEYWIDWRVNGSLASGPWQPPIFKTGTQTTGNGIQYSAGSWAPAYFNSTSVACQQGLPFLVYGVNGTGIQDIEADNLNVYPNPAKDQITINSSSLVKEVKILNSLGQVVLNQSIMSFNPTVNVSNISAGLYFIQITTEKGLSTKKININ